MKKIDYTPQNPVEITDNERTALLRVLERHHLHPEENSLVVTSRKGTIEAYTYGVSFIGREGKRVAHQVEMYSNGSGIVKSNRTHIQILTDPIQRG